MPPFDPELQRLARFLPRRAVGPRSLPFVRFLTRLASRRVPPDLELFGVGEVTVRLHRPPVPPREPGPALLWIHGGGYVIGAAAQDDAVCRRYAAELGAVVAAVDYRLAPEHPFPVPLDDCHDALVWLAGRDDVDADRVAIGGASAGGGLAAGLALLARDRGEVRPVAQILAYPMVDDRTVLRTDIDERNFRMWNNEANRFGWTSYLGHPPGAPTVSGLAAPARHDDLSGLPRAWIGVGDLDLFHDEDLAYAERLRAAGVECRLDVVPGAFHGFDAVRSGARVSKAFLAAQLAELESAFAVEAT
jgi:acetyl esterase/lipase